MKMDCKKCQTETEHYVNGKCKQCAKVQNAAWYAANTEHIKATSAARYAANPELYNARCAAWSKANPEHRDNSARRASLKATDAARYAANPEIYKAKSAAYHAAHPEGVRIHAQNRKARKLENGGVLSKGITAKLFKLQRGLCPCCDQSLGADFHLDHIMPLALGGPNIDNNMQLLRQRCNNQKSAAHPIDFMQSRGFLV